MKSKLINIILFLIILIEFGIIKSESNKSVEESIPTVNIREETSLNDIIKKFNNDGNLKIINIINNKDYYSIEVQINGDKKEFISNLEKLEDYNIVGYELEVVNQEIIGDIMLKYNLNS
jgi:hypothetical protein